MEEFYRPEIFGATIRFPLKSYFEEFKTLPMVNYGGENPETENDKLVILGERMGSELDNDALKQIAEDCSISSLTCEGENPNYPLESTERLFSTTQLKEPYVNTDGKNDLEVQKFKNEFSDEDLEHLIQKNNKKLLTKAREFEILPESPKDLTVGCDFLVLIRIYRPFNFNYFNRRNFSERLQFSQEIIALGSNTLYEIRDLIYCGMDNGICQEVETTSDQLSGREEVKNEYPSGFLFIDNIFYNDMREPSAINYSTTIINWAKDKKINGLKATDMGNLRIDSLTVRFGYPYLYMHQGDCEHILVFSDARLLGINDCLHSQSYPHILKFNRKNNRSCCLCSVSFAKWICMDYDRFPQNKVFLCTDCCNSYNYIDGKKVGNFKLYPYYESRID